MESIVAIFAVLAIKLTAMTAGYKIVVLGHDTLVKGLKGDFEFTGSVGKEGSIKLKSVSPGLLFVFLGTLLIGWAVFVDKPIKYSDGTIKSQALAPKIRSNPDFEIDSTREQVK